MASEDEAVLAPCRNEPSSSLGNITSVRPLSNNHVVPGAVVRPAPDWSAADKGDDISQNRGLPRPPTGVIYSESGWRSPHLSTHSSTPQGLTLDTMSPHVPAPQSSNRPFLTPIPAVTLVSRPHAKYSGGHQANTWSRLPPLLSSYSKQMFQQHNTQRHIRRRKQPPLKTCFILVSTRRYRPHAWSSLLAPTNRGCETRSCQGLKH